MIKNTTIRWKKFKIFIHTSNIIEKESYAWTFIIVCCRKIAKEFPTMKFMITMKQFILTPMWHTSSSKEEKTKIPLSRTRKFQIEDTSFLTTASPQAKILPIKILTGENSKSRPLAWNKGKFWTMQKSRSKKPSWSFKTKRVSWSEWMACKNKQAKPSQSTFETYFRKLFHEHAKFEASLLCLLAYV